MGYLKDAVNRKRTAQSDPISGTSQVPNSAGGFAFPVDDWTRLERFLILGTEGGSYYAGERKLSRENADVVVRCLAANGPDTVARIVAVSEAGRAPKNDPAIFALALAASSGDDATRRAALGRLRPCVPNGRAPFPIRRVRGRNARMGKGSPGSGRSVVRNAADGAPGVSGREVRAAGRLEPP